MSLIVCLNEEGQTVIRDLDEKGHFNLGGITEEGHISHPFYYGLEESISNVISKLGPKRIFVETLQTAISKLGLKRIFTETLQIVGSISKTFTKASAETLQIVISKLGPKRIFTETFQTVDSIKKTFTKIRTETLAIFDTVTDWWARLLTEFLAVTIVKSSIVEKSFAEAFSHSVSILKTPIKGVSELIDIAIGRSVNALGALGETLALALSKAATATHALTGAFSVTGSLIKTPIKKLGEAFKSSPVFSWFEHGEKGLFETLNCAISKVATVTKAKSEAFSFTEVQAKTVTLAKIEALLVVVERIPEKLKQLVESLALAVSKSAIFTKAKSETLGFSDSRMTTFAKKIAEDLNLARAISTLGTKIRALSESLDLVDVIKTTRIRVARKIIIATRERAASVKSFVRKVKTVVRER